MIGNTMGYWRITLGVALSGSLSLAGVTGCSKSGSGGSDMSAPSTSGTSSASGTSGTSSASSSGGPGAGGAPNDRPPPTGPTDAYDSGRKTVGQLTAPPATKLPVLPSLSNVLAEQGDDSVSLTFDPVDGALDYRVYPLPADGDISTAADGAVIVHNATYRCAGDREAPPTMVDDGPEIASDAIRAQVDKQTVGGYKRVLADATLGYVYTHPGKGLVPVYAMGDADPNADSTCFFARWKESRVKKYTTSETERTQLLAALSRDDGVVFYVPAAADDTTVTIYSDDKSVPTRYYLADGPESAAHAGKTAAFQVLKAAADGTQPLMRVFYNNRCGASHDELAVGKERFNRAYHQGDKLPSFSLEWSGIKEKTTLVVEALDSGCPYQGYLSAQAVPSVTGHLGAMDLVHQPWITLDDARAASPTGEVFVNGQHEATNKPKAIARSFVAVEPQPHPKMDFFAPFAAGTAAEAFTTVPCGTDNCYATYRQQSKTFDQIWIDVEAGPTMNTGLISYGPMLGELWVSYADTAGDTNGKFRLTANQKATMSDSKFLHVTMEVDAYATARRYPQILISDAEAPVQYGLVKGHTIIVQPRAEIGPAYDYPINYELQLCKLRTWDVNNQCPVYDLHHQLDSAGTPTHLAPNDEFGEHTGADHPVLFDVFASTKRAYLFLDGQPYGCAELPADAAPTGSVTVTWGDALYHSEIDVTYAFHAAHMQIEQRRHFDNLGFSSGLDAPTWDETRLPCAAPIAL
ncbi:MAG: hypothetical protein ABI488_21345 [Polyangiaceae bacterium]